MNGDFHRVYLYGTSRLDATSKIAALLWVVVVMCGLKNIESHIYSMGTFALSLCSTVHSSLPQQYRNHISSLEPDLT